MGGEGIVLNSLLVIKLVYYKIINKFRIIYIENCKIYITKLQKLILSKWITLTFPCTFYETRSSSNIYNLLNSIHWLSSNERIHSNKQKIPFVLSSYCFQSVRPSRRRASLTTYTLRLRTLFLAAQKGCTPCTKNKLQRGCLSTDASWRIVTWIRFLTPLDVVVVPPSTNFSNFSPPPRGRR